MITTHESAIRIISKVGQLANAADRDHCLQYMTAIGLICGGLTAEHYEDKAAADPRIDALRARMVVRENPAFTRDYFDPDRRYIGNAIQIHFKDGSHTDRIAIDTPLGHRDRRGEGIPLLLEKFESAVAGQLPARRVQQILALTGDTSRFEATPIHRFVDLFTL